MAFKGGGVLMRSFERYLAAGLALALIAGSAVGQDTAPEQRTPPSFKVRPSQELLSEHFPAAALAAGKSGRAVVECMVSAQGLATDCVPLAEDPPGFGFGAAAVSMQSFLQMTPGTVNGVPTPMKVRFPIDFTSDGVRTPTGGTTRLYSNLPWSSAPTFEQWAAAYPEKAKAAKGSGAVNMRCTFRDEGRIGGCVVMTESPQGMGFGPAARSLAEHFVGPAVDAAGGRTRGGQVNIQIAFSPKVLDGGKAANSPLMTTGPTREQLLAAFPKAAQEAGVLVGGALLRCDMQQFKAVNCKVDAETHPGKGFDQAALAVSGSLRFSVWSADGLPTNERLLLPIEFDRRPVAVAAADPKEALLARAREGTQMARDGEFAEASAVVEELALAQDTFPARALAMTIANRLATAKRLDEADKAADRAGALAATDPAFLNDLCWWRATNGVDLAQAVADCETALRLRPGMAQYMDSLGFAYLRAGSFEKAIATYDEALKLRPNSAYSLYGRGIAKRRVGNRTADADIAAARRLDVNMPRTFQGYGVAP